MSPSSAELPLFPVDALQMEKIQAAVRRWITGNPFPPRYRMPDATWRPARPDLEREIIRSTAAVLLAAGDPEMRARYSGLLSELAAAGLERRLGRSIEAAARPLYRALAELGFADAGGYYVCRGLLCGIVIYPKRKPSARPKCPRCHRAPKRMPPVRSNRSTTLLRRGALGQPDANSIEVLNDCRTCGTAFWCSDARQLDCPACGHPRERTRRSRARGR